MIGPFTVRRRDGCEYVSIYSADEIPVCTIEANADRSDEAVAFALIGALNSAPAGQPLAVTLANLAAGRAA